MELADGADVPHSDGRVPAAVGEVQINDIGQTTEAYELVGNGETIDLAELQEAWESALEIMDVLDKRYKAYYGRTASNKKSKK